MLGGGESPGPVFNQYGEVCTYECGLLQIRADCTEELIGMCRNYYPFLSWIYFIIIIIRLKTNQGGHRWD